MNPKAKGSKWERDFCKELSLWWSKGKDQDIFWRTASSGGKASISKDLSTQIGDVTYIKPEGKQLIDNFVFELKHYKYERLDFLPLLDCKGNIFDWWVKLCRESIEYSKTPFLIIKVSSRDVYCLTVDSYLQDLYEKDMNSLGIPSSRKLFNLNTFEFNSVTLPIGVFTFSMFRFREFLTLCSENPSWICLF